MSTRFKRAMVPLGAHEGGYVNHPDDPGGATNRGVTQRVYNNWCRLKGKPPRSVKHITKAESMAIYKMQYWDAVRADELPTGVGYCVFDAAVNSGPTRAIKWLQQAIGAKVDGHLGAETLHLASVGSLTQKIDRYCDIRLAFMKRLRHWPTFKNGWTRRVSEVRKQAKTWAVDSDIDAMPVSQPAAQAKAVGPTKRTTTVWDTLTDKGALTTIGGLVGSSGALASGDGPLQYAIAIVLVIAALAGVYVIIRKMKED